MYSLGLVIFNIEMVFMHDVNNALKYSYCYWKWKSKNKIEPVKPLYIILINIVLIKFILVKTILNVMILFNNITL